MNVLFVSDIHLDVKTPEIGDQFVQFLNERGPAADALYILGDLFESWVGDDDPQPERQRIGTALNRLTDAGVPCYFMHGNRDFLVADDFAAKTGLQLLDEEVVIELAGNPVLLMHGDSLCTDDEEYQAFRRTVRDPDWQKTFLAMPLQQRLAMAVEARQRSQTHNAQTAAEIMDVNQEAVAATMRRHGVRRLLHGHTHRPDIHEFRLGEETATRIVLGDWYQQGSVVTWDNSGPTLESLSR